MPAVTADTLTLARVPRAGLGDVERPVLRRHDGAAGLRGRGLPGPPRLRRHRAALPRPVHHDGPDGRGGVRAGRAQGHLVAPAPRLRDRHLHHGRRLPAPGQPRRRRLHQGRRHPVDDRRRRHPAHRDPAGRAGPQRRHVPRHAALGEPAVQAEDDRARVPEPRGRGRHAAGLRRRRRAAARHRRATSAGHTGPGLDPHPDHLACTRPSPPARSCRMPWEPEFNALVYVLSGTRHGRRRGPADLDRARPRCSAPATTSRSAPTTRRRAGTARSRCWCSAASRSASRSRSTARSS